MIYSDWTTALAGYLPENLANAASSSPFIASSRYNLVIARCIEYAEMRIYRDPELDFLVTRLNVFQPLVRGVRRQYLPAATIIIEQANIVLPAGANPGDAGSSRVPLEPASLAYVNAAWPAQTYQSIPEHFCRTDDGTIAVGPVPDQAYTIEYYGTFRPNPLSSNNVSTVLTVNFPDLFLAASMIFMSGYQKTFGAMSGDPQQGMTWEQYYGELKRGAVSEEARKKFESSDWSSLTPATQATPPRA